MAAGQHAFENLIQGNLGAAARSVIDPESLAPKERETPFLDAFFGPDDGTITRRVLNVISDPWVAIGLAGSLAYPIGSAKKLFDVSKRIGLLERTFLPGTTKLLSFNNLFRGHKIQGETQTLVRTITDFKRRHTDIFNDAIFNFEKSAGRALTKKDRILLGMELDGLTRAGNPTLEAFGLESAFGNVRVPTEIKSLSKTIRKGLDGVWDESVGTEKGKKAIRELKGFLTSEGIDPDDGVGFIKGFFPHQRIRGPGGSFVDPRAAAQTTKVAAKSLTEKRKLRLLPSLDDVREVEEYLRPGAVQSLERTIAATTAGQYGLDATRTIPRYLNQVAKTVGFSIEGHGKTINKSIKELKKLAEAGNPNAEVAARIMEQNIIPAIKQTRTPAEGLSAAVWASTRGGLIKSLDSAISAVGSNKSMGKFLRETRKLIGETDPGKASSKLAGYIYLNSLGANISVALKNTGQPFLTTAPVIGVGHTLKGMGDTVEQARKYFTLRASKVPAFRAFEKAFPRFTKSGIAPDVLADEIRQSLESSFLATAAPGVAKAADRAQAALMSFFTGSERWNRLSTFSGGIRKAVADGIKGEAAQNRFAAQLVDLTQFTGGPLGTPIGALGLNPLLRQFTTFPIRFGEFVGSTATALGSAEQAIGGNIPFVSGRNYGTISRMLLAGGLIRQGGKQVLGTDLEDFTFTGALPVPRGYGALGALPFAPPAVSLAASAALDISNREFNQLRYAVPSLVPGGAALARGLGFSGLPYSRDIAQTLGRRFTDYDDVDAEGKLPLYDGRGNLQTRLSPWQLYTFAAGIPVGDVQREQEKLAIVMKNKDRIRAARKQYADALHANDQSKALAVREQFKRAYGIELQLRPQELKSAGIRRQMNRLERQLNTLPRATRPVVEQVLRAYAAQQITVFQESGVDPIFLEPSPDPARERRQRQSSRPRTAGVPVSQGRIGSELFDRVPESAF